MRNLKKVLSLALALVMLLGMMVVGASAAYRDEANIGDDYKEAVGVVSAIKVLQGLNSTTFGPNDTLTRAQAATIITRALVGPSTVEAMSKATESSFTDMAGAQYAIGPVEYCVDAGITVGIGNGKFNPNGPVTNAQFTAMVLRALGLVDVNKPNGNWKTEAALVAAQKGLLGDNLSVNDSPMKRQEAAQMAFNVIQYSPSGSNGYTVAGSNVVFPDLVTALMAAGMDPTQVYEAPAEDTLAKRVFKLTSDTKDDGFGHAVKTWNVDGEEVWVSSTPISTPKKTFTNQTIKDSDLKGLTFSNNAKDVKITDGKSEEGAITAAVVTGLGQDNNTVELYAGSDGKINKVIVVNTYAAKVSAVTPARGSSDRSITVDSLKYETEDFEKGDIVLYKKSWDADNNKFNIKNVVAAESIEGEMTSYTGKPPVKYTIAGTAYELSTGAVSGFNDGALKDVTEGTYYLGTNGKIVYAVAANGTTANTGNYAVIASAHAELKEAVWPATEKSVTLKVKALLSDGTLGIYTVDGVNYVAAKDGDKEKAELKIGSDTLELLTTNDKGTVVKGDSALLTELNGIYDYTLDGEKIKLNSKVAALTTSATAGDVVSDTTTDAVKKDSITLTANTDSKKVIINNKTVFVLLSEDGKAGKVVTGAAALGNTSITAGKAQAVIDVVSSTTLTAKVVFAKDINFAPGETATGNYAYLTGDYSRTTSKDADGKYTFTYTGISSDGEEVTLTKKAASDPGVKEGVYAIGNDVTLGTVHKAKKVTVTAYSDGVLTVNEAAGGTDNTETAFKVPEAAKIVVAEDGAVLEAGAQVYIVWNASAKNQADIIFVLKAAPEKS